MFPVMQFTNCINEEQVFNIATKMVEDLKHKIEQYIANINNIHLGCPETEDGLKSISSGCVTNSDVSESCKKQAQYP